jgi:peptidoglycan/LPS O-acetylase OafA/YrhL
MGILRLLLAVSVVINHTGPILGLTLVGGPVAVKAFYIISGFYMSLILNEKYTADRPRSYRLFIINRFLRLYPVYWAVLVLTLLLGVAVWVFGNSATGGPLQGYVKYFDAGSSFPLLTWLFLIVTHLILFGQDLAMFLGVNATNGSLFFTRNFALAQPQLHSFLLLPQAWTIGLELTFYLIAPFIVRRKLPLIIGLIIIFTVLRLIAYSNGLNHDPWTYRFFPFELAFFLLGNISYRLYTKLRTVEIANYINFSALFILFGLTIIYRYLPVYINILYYAAWCVLIPFVFLLTKSSKLDSRIGELSYPVYICHILVLLLLLLIPGFIVTSGKVAVLTIILSIGLSLVLNRFIAAPIEKIRQARLRRVSATQNRWW